MVHGIRDKSIAEMFSYIYHMDSNIFVNLGLYIFH